jgi:hypothetical protein
VVVGWWQDGDAGEYIWMRRFVGGSWEPRPFYVQGGTAVTTFADRTRPGLGIDASGTAGLFYLGKVDSVSDNRFQAFWAQWNGVAKPAWDTTVVSDQLYAAPTILSVSEAGTAYATWAGLPDSKMLRPLYLNQYEAGSWGTPMQFGTVPDDGGPWYYYKTGNDAGDTALLVRREAQIRPFLLHGTDVVTPGALTLPAPSPLNALSLHLDDARNIVVVVLAGAEALKLQPYRIRCPVGAATCSSPEAIGSTTASSIALAGNPSGVLQVLTLDSSADTNQGHIVARTYSESAGWSEGERISDDFTLLTEGSSISTSANSWGDIVVAWQQSTTLADGSSGKALAFNHYSPKDGWAKAGIVTTYPGVLGLVGVTLHDDGHALLVWDHQPVMDQASHLKWSRN